MAEFSPWEVQPLEAYASGPSVVAGDRIGFHVSVADPSGGPVVMKVYRSTQLAYDDGLFGVAAERIYQGDWRERITVHDAQEPAAEAAFVPEHHATPDDASRNGCGWPEAIGWDVPAETPSGVYVARFRHEAATTYALFVVRAADPGQQSRVLAQLSSNTYQAYNPFGGLCFYAHPIGRPGDPPVVDRVSFDRPCQLWDFILYESRLVAWMEDNCPAEWCTNVDLDADHTLLDGHQLFISSGHDEYWSPVMRDRLDAFASSGGNVMFLTGNTCFRHVDLHGTQLIRAGDSWSTEGRPEARTTGLNFSAGFWSKSVPARGFTVRMPSHWMLDGTGLGDGAILGDTERVIGYETDAIVVDGDSNPVDPTPAGYLTVADADLPDWEDSPGRATLGLFWRDGQGVVMAAGTTGWGQALAQPGKIERVMRNTVGRLRRRVGVLYAVTPSGDLWWYRDRTLDGGGEVASPRVVGHGGWDGFVDVFCGGHGTIYAVDVDGHLLRYVDVVRDGTGDVANPQVIGHGGWESFTHRFAGGDGVIYGVTPDGELERYVDEGGGQALGDGEVISMAGWDRFSSVFSGGDGLIYAVTVNGDLVWHLAGGGGVSSPRVIGHGGWNGFHTVLSGGSGVIYAVNDDGDLLSYRDRNRDGTGDVAHPEVIGHGGWNQFVGLFSGT